MPFIDEARCGYGPFCRQLVVRLAKALAEVHPVSRILLHVPLTLTP